MKNLTIQEWEDKYIRGEVARFDQKNYMVHSPRWDPQINGMIHDWSFNGPPVDIASFMLEAEHCFWQKA